MSSQETFLARVRRALHREPVPATLGPPLVWRDPQEAAAVAALQASLAARRANLVARVEQELTAVGGVVRCVHTPEEAVEYVIRLAREKGATLVVRWQSTLLEALEIEAVLQQHGVAVQATTPPVPVAAGDTTTAALAARRQELRDLLAHADLGLSGVDYVIAETGTLVLAALPGQMRGVSLVPPVHVAIARASQVLPTLADYLRLVQAAGPELQHNLSSCVSFVTGPSRTGDIELQLTVGVHGPGELHLVILDEAGT